MVLYLRISLYRLYCTPSTPLVTDFRLSGVNKLGGQSFGDAAALDKLELL